MIPVLIVRLAEAVTVFSAIMLTIVGVGLLRFNRPLKGWFILLWALALTGFVFWVTSPIC